MSHHFAEVTVLASYFVMKEYDQSVGRLVFSGAHKPGSLGNDDAEFIKVKITRVLTDGGLHALIVDFSDMFFEHGLAIQDAIDKLQTAKIPVAIVYGEKCRAMVQAPADLYVDSVEKALQRIAAVVALDKR